MGNKIFIDAAEIADELGVSKPYAYKVIKKMNAELKERGFVVISGRVSRKYYHEKFYGSHAKEEEAI